MQININSGFYPFLLNSLPVIQLFAVGGSLMVQIVEPWDKTSQNTSRTPFVTATFKEDVHFAANDSLNAGISAASSITNIFAWRSTDPRPMKAHTNPSGKLAH